MKIKRLYVYLSSEHTIKISGKAFSQRVYKRTFI